MTRWWAIVVLAGCSSSNEPQLIAGFNPPPIMQGETMTVVSPVIKDIAPGADVTYCTYLDTRLTELTDVTAFRAYQSVPGHHLMMVAVKVPQEPNTHVCTDDDMVNITTFVAGGGPNGESLHFKGVPAGLAFRIPKGAQLMLQSHWINASQVKKDGQAKIYLEANPASPSVIPTDQFLADTVAFDIPAGQTATATSTCKFQQDMSFFMIGGHMHEWGKHVDLELIDESGAASMIYSQDWQPAFMTDPPVNYFTKEQPFVIKSGQSVRITCQWDNTSGSDDIRFPKEMCYFVGYYFPGNGLMDCTDGIWPTK